ncbi:MAG: endopeptidase La [Gammaproteobacteria bacterium]|jgi:ATP-dependent Lon protease
MGETKEQKNNDEMVQIDECPVLPLRDVVVYPNMVMPLFVGRKSSVLALEKAMNDTKRVLLITQRDAEIEEPKEDELYTIGTIASILQLLKLPDGTVKVLVEGEHRAQIKKIIQEQDYLLAEVNVLESKFKEDREIEILLHTAEVLFEQYVRLNKKIPIEILGTLENIDDTNRLVDIMIAHLVLKIADKQNLLEAYELRARLNLLIKYLENGIDTLQIQKRVNTRVKSQIDKSQREYYLNEQMKAIQKELGDAEGGHDEVKELERKIAESGMSKEARIKAKTELQKLKMMPSMSAEATVCRNYLDALINVPWKKKSKINRDLERAEKILNDEHYGLEKVKERIIEYLAVQSRVEKLKGPILCLVGPPGVGKTSLGRSIAHATGRKFVRMSLGGMRDEAEIRGHRRTYIGALPGKIIQNITKTRVRNPLFLLDEVDKMAMDFRGDPASALLEVLDPEQNNSFNDHYLEVDYDLSDVMFVTTANTAIAIPPPLFDRMEVIELAGYTEDEKINIAQRHLIKKQLEANGLQAKEITFSEDALRDIIRYYTREAGVRNLERAIAKICRKVVKSILQKSSRKEVSIKSENLEEYLGVRKYRFGEAEKEDQIGEVTGLAWTEVGGELLSIESAIMPGKGNAIITGQLGEVMQESVQAALSVVRNRASSLGIKPEIFEKNDIHIHVPEGAIPKDGPSAGVAMCTTLVSVLTKNPVRADVAMTGEITLRGEVLPIGGLKEKLLAARRGGIKQVIIPEENSKDLKEIPNNITDQLKIHPVRWIDDVFRLALVQSTATTKIKAKPKTKTKAKVKTKVKTKSKIKSKSKKKQGS